MCLLFSGFGGVIGRVSSNTIGGVVIFSGFMNFIMGVRCCVRVHLWGGVLIFMDILLWGVGWANFSVELVWYLLVVEILTVYRPVVSVIPLTTIA